MTALALGIASVVLLRGVSDGVQALNRSLFVDGTLGALQVHRAGYTEAAELMPLSLDFADTPELRRTLLGVKGVKAIAPRIYFGAALAPPGDREAQYFMAIAVDPALEAQVSPRRVSWASTWLDGAKPQVLLDATFSAALGLVPGGDLPALLANDRDDLFNGEAVELAGSIGMPMPADVRQGLVTLSAAQRLLRSEGRAAEYGVAVHDPADIPRIRDDLRRALGPDFEVHAWFERMPALLDVERMQDVFGAMLGGIVLLVVLLGVGNLQLMGVMDRVKEVGTLLAIGMRRRRVVGLFVLEGLWLGLAGTLLGLLVGEAGLAAIRWQGLSLAAPGSALEQAIVPVLGGGWRVLIVAAGVLGSTVSSGLAARRLAKLTAAEALAET